MSENETQDFGIGSPDEPIGVTMDRWAQHIANPRSALLYAIHVLDDACGRKIEDEVSFRLDFEGVEEKGGFLVELWNKHGHITFTGLTDTMRVDKQQRPWLNVTGSEDMGHA